MSRKLNRNLLKKKYERFCEAWRNEKRYQAHVMENGGLVRGGASDPHAEPGSPEFIVAPDGEQAIKLGRKPTFAMWLVAYKNRQTGDQPQQPETKQVEVDATDWEE